MRRMVQHRGSFGIKRIYDPPADDDGCRVLVDRLWPRGMPKENAAIDLWLKDVAPSPGLRKDFNHRPERFAEFSERYQVELDSNQAVGTLLELAGRHARVTLLYAARNTEANHARVLLDYLRGRPAG
ncbi:DUF488 domain-containing protein [Pseudarthrobacter sp. BRE9]|jgi:uncharacterized protein YeaO (DUF488 family)|uniref:DUF488 domain-containing protein n=1 Tax=Pseudarthrobacter sp. BRE9 TaxID=2962582 RepID=UPI002880BFF1|nr:DUF488 domain-containing protein [Pseudarthrobacter sp. BRE9]MDT0168946.1 DUF488 domain-containing protein [Pseudarthrobacter sp. BRE9]